MHKLLKWATLKKIGDIADLLFKLAAAFAALVTANFFLFQPNLQSTVSSAVFIDRPVLNRLYHGQVPTLVGEVVAVYEKLNSEDLITGVNTTYGKDPAFNLCQRGSSMVNTIMFVFKEYGEIDCTDANLRLGLGRYYERYLLQLNADRGSPLTDKDLRTAIKWLHAAEYREARIFLKNDGSTQAAQVTVASPYSFHADPEFDNDNNKKVDPFYINAKKTKAILFRTDPGNANPAGYTDTESQFPVDWDRVQGIGSLLQSTPGIQYGFFLLALVLGIIFVAVVANDIRIYPDGVDAGNVEPPA